MYICISAWTTCVCTVACHSALYWKQEIDYEGHVPERHTSKTKILRMKITLERKIMLKTTCFMRILSFYHFMYTYTYA